jgi:hypothetical protein
VFETHILRSGSLVCTPHSAFQVFWKILGRCSWERELCPFSVEDLRTVTHVVGGDTEYLSTIRRFLEGVSGALGFDERNAIPTLEALHLLARGMKRVAENTCLDHLDQEIIGHSVTFSGNESCRGRTEDDGTWLGRIWRHALGSQYRLSVERERESAMINTGGGRQRNFEQ